MAKKKSRDRRAEELEAIQKNHAAPTAHTTHDNITKVTEDGETAVVPTDAIYKEEHPIKGPHLDVEDRTVGAAGGPRRSIKDEAEVKLGLAERGDQVSAQHATGPSGPVPNEPEDATEDSGKDSKSKKGK